MLAAGHQISSQNCRICLHFFSCDQCMTGRIETADQNVKNDLLILFTFCMVTHVCNALIQNQAQELKEIQ